MFARRLYTVIAALLLLMTAMPGCATDVFQVGIEPAGQSNSNDALREELAPIMKAILTGNVTSRLAILDYRSTPCANIDALGGPPRCPEGMPEGTVVDVLPILGPEGVQATADDMQEIMNNLHVKGLYAVYRVTPGPVVDPLYPTGDYAMLFDRDMNDLPMPLVLQVRDGHVVRMDFPVGIPPEDMLGEVPVEQVLISPSEARVWSEEIRAGP